MYRLLKYPSIQSALDRKRAKIVSQNADLRTLKQTARHFIRAEPEKVDAIANSDGAEIIAKFQVFTLLSGSHQNISRITWAQFGDFK